MIAPVTAMVFVWKLAVLGRERKWRLLRGILAKLAAFGAVCIPLGLWYPVRNLILFGQPLGYVAPIGEDAAIYCGNEAWRTGLCLCFPRIGRKAFTVTPLRIIIIFAYATKCSVFGETALSGSGVAAAALLVCAFILITGALTAMVYVLGAGQK